VLNSLSDILLRTEASTLAVPFQTQIDGPAINWNLTVLIKRIRTYVNIRSQVITDFKKS